MTGEYMLVSAHLLEYNVSIITEIDPKRKITEDRMREYSVEENDTFI